MLLSVYQATGGDRSTPTERGSSSDIFCEFSLHVWKFWMQFHKRLLLSVQYFQRGNIHQLVSSNFTFVVDSRKISHKIVYPLFYHPLHVNRYLPTAGSLVFLISNQQVNKGSEGRIGEARNTKLSSSGP
jgi:hypothetical protein